MSLLASLPVDDDELLESSGFNPLIADEESLFPEDCWLRRINGEQAVLFGGGRALLLEIAHPLIAAGVAEHSNFRTDPLGRLQRTLDAMGAIAFGRRSHAVAAARSVERVHGSVKGVLGTDAGPFSAETFYHGRDPELMRWVWATLADTALVVYERFVETLDESARNSYFADHSRMARLLGIPADEVPANHAEFRSYFDAMLEGDTLTVTSTARDIAKSVLEPPVRNSGTGTLRSVTAMLLPDRLRGEFGLRWDERRAAKMESFTRSIRELRKGSQRSRGDSARVPPARTKRGSQNG